MAKNEVKCRTCGAPPRHSSGIAWAELDDQSPEAGAITCPHCGAPVKHVPPPPPAPVAAPPVQPGADDMADVPAAPPSPAPPVAAPPVPPMDEQAGDADALEELDTTGEFMENATDTGDDPGMKDVRDKTTDLEASDGDAELDESAEMADGDAEMADGDAELEEMADAAQPNKPSVASPKALAGVKLPPKPPMAAAKPPAPPLKPAAPAVAPPVGMSDALKELRRLSEKVAAMEREQELRRRRARINKGLTLLQRGLREGKLTRRMIGTAQTPTETRKFAMRDPKGFEQWLAKEAPIAVEFKERGVAQDRDDLTAVSLAEKVDGLAKQMMKAEPDTYSSDGRMVRQGLDYKTATQRVLSENPTLAQGYDREMSNQTGGVRLREATSSNSKL